MPNSPEKDIFSQYELLAPLGTVVLALIGYAWNKMDRQIEKILESMEKHAASDDAIHKDLYDHLRQDEAKLNHLLGEHDRRRLGDRRDEESDDEKPE